MMADKPLYSTDSGWKQSETKDKKSRKQRPSSKQSKSWSKATGPMKMRLETKGRGGKAVTVLFNVPLDKEDAQALLKTIQGKLGVGGTLKNDHMELRGDVRQKLEIVLQGIGHKVIRAGG